MTSPPLADVNRYAFDYVFDATATQRAVYENTTKFLIQVRNACSLFVTRDKNPAFRQVYFKLGWRIQCSSTTNNRASGNTTKRKSVSCQVI